MLSCSGCIPFSCRKTAKAKERGNGAGQGQCKVKDQGKSPGKAGRSKAGGDGRSKAAGAAAAPAGGKRRAAPVLQVTARNLRQILGAPRYVAPMIERHHRVGIATGLAWTEAGGEVLTVEVAVVPGKGELKLTGKLGEVMRESGMAALSYARARAGLLGLERDFYSAIDIHLHLPEGAIPKDGPSAGITMAVAMISALTGVATCDDLAMTGEITLRGAVLPIGGLNEKVVAARQHGITRLLIPEGNTKDLPEVPREALRGIEIITVASMDEVLRHAFVEPVVKAGSDERKPGESAPGVYAH